ncbi:hypothetical protein NQ318_016518 [Aromia moschata]|uniref:SWIM-type domain-containing protein n=1 Tax=Aromia moschata TaxID=1265417 RepID=A0AAV8YXK6_9CUCU|nr:hypothetical protein NQ318_016518 [Aromia moschata]
MEEAIVPKLAFEVLKDAERVYKETGTFSQELLENLHSLFGESFVLATELLEKRKIIEYEVDNGLRRIFKVIMGKEQYTVYENINFCHCKTFHLQVLEARNILTCKHILAVKLCQIMGRQTNEKVTNSQLVDFLNEQFSHLEENLD